MSKVNQVARYLSWQFSHGKQETLGSNPGRAIIVSSPVTCIHRNYAFEAFSFLNNFKFFLLYGQSCQRAFYLCFI